LAGNLSSDLAILALERGWQDRRAFVSGDRVWTHGDVHDGAARAGGLLAELGVVPGDRVLIALSDGIAFVWSFLAAARIGAIAIPVNPRLSRLEHDFLLADSEPSLVVCDAPLLERFAGARAIAGEELERLAPTCSPAPAIEVDPATAAYAQYTSGTTGKPKAALHRHSDPACYTAAMAVGALRMTEDDLVMSISRAYFAYGLGNTVIFPLHLGAAAILHPEVPTVEVATELARRHQPSVLFCVPSFYAVLVARGDREPFRCVRVAVSSGEVLTPALFERIEHWLGKPALDSLGSTEIGQAFVANRPDRVRAGTCGLTLPGYQVSVRDDEGRILPAETEGLLWVQGLSVLIGYRNRPDATAEALVDGWLRTKDRAIFDADGFLHHLGRADDLEIVGGINVNPLEVETLLVSHPAVTQAAVAALSDAVGATKLRAFVVGSPGYPPSPKLEQELLDLVRAHHAHYEVPRSVRWVEALPRTPTGKLQRFVLRTGWPDVEAVLQS
jgi:4-hydroxybenzoate adenylyltransferase